MWKTLGLAPVFTVDCTPISRPDSKTSPKRAMVHLGDQLHNQPGWCYQHICAQTLWHNSWNLCIEVTRVDLAPEGTLGRGGHHSPMVDKEQLAIESMQAITAELGVHCTFVLIRDTQLSG
jgi:hypothetical protein